MYSHAGRFVHHQKVLVFKHNIKLARRHGSPGLIGFLRQPDRRNPHFIARGQTAVGSGTLFVHAHFAAPDDAVDMALGHAFEQADEKVIQTLPGGGFVHAQIID